MLIFTFDTLEQDDYFQRLHQHLMQLHRPSMNRPYSTVTTLTFLINYAGQSSRDREATVRDTSLSCINVDLKQLINAIVWVELFTYLTEGDIVLQYKHAPSSFLAQTNEICPNLYDALNNYLRCDGTKLWLHFDRAAQPMHASVVSRYQHNHAQPLMHGHQRNTMYGISVQQQRRSTRFSQDARTHQPSRHNHEQHGAYGAQQRASTRFSQDARTHQSSRHEQDLEPTHFAPFDFRR